MRKDGSAIKTAGGDGVLPLFPHVFKSNDRVFPMTKEAFKQSWADVRKRAGIKADARGEMLEFKDLRREAGSRFDEAGLTKAEHDLMMGHANSDMTSLYISSHLKSIQDKLDKHVLGGKTFEDALQDGSFWERNKAKAG